MKTRFSLLLALCLAAPGAGALTPGHLEGVRPQNFHKFLARRVADGRPVTYCLDLPDGDDAFLTEQNAHTQLRAALNEWTRGMALRIRAAGRETEFADLLPLLENARFIRVPRCDWSEHPGFQALYPSAPRGDKADVSVVISSRYCGDYFNKTTSFFSYEYKNAAPFICVLREYTDVLKTAGGRIPTAFSDEDKRLIAAAPRLMQNAAAGRYASAGQQDLWAANLRFYYDDPTYFSILAHELGHAFGLSDDYTSAGEDPLYAPVKPGEDIMRYGYRPVGCGELDSLITLLDRMRGTRRTFKSFCANGVTFQNGVQQVEKDTPVKLVLTPGHTALYTLTPASAADRAYRLETLEDSGPENRTYTRGTVAHPDRKTGTWLKISRRNGRFSAAQTIYGEDGKPIQETAVPFPPADAARLMDRLLNAKDLNVLKVQDELKRQ